MGKYSFSGSTKILRPLPPATCPFGTVTSEKVSSVLGPGHPSWWSNSSSSTHTLRGRPNPVKLKNKKTNATMQSRGQCSRTQFFISIFICEESRIRSHLEIFFNILFFLIILTAELLSFDCFLTM